jgi:ADP-ribose pyrophosphatase YjhB (NUDIX family)
MDVERKILNLFLYNHKLRFRDIEDSLKLRSNKIAYHVKNLVNRKILVNEKGYYSLSDSSEHLIPYLSDKSSVLPVVLIHIGDNKRVFLYDRNKRPYKGKLSMPGGRILLGENLNSAVERIMKNNFNISSKFAKVNSISFEQVKKSGKIVHSFLLIFVTAKTKDKIELVELKKNKRKIIPSDYLLLTNDLDKSYKLKTIYSRI